MNFSLPGIPDRSAKPRNSGLTMVMDKGLSLADAKNFVEVAASYTDIVKLGFGTAYVTPKLSEKIQVYQDAGLDVYFGGTLFEAFIARGQFEEYRELLRKYQLRHVEVSDGTLQMSALHKCRYIELLAKEFTVLSEVGSKDAEVIYAPYKWLEMMKSELNAGAWKVVAESREAGNVGIFRGTGEVRSGLIDEILSQIPAETVLWEAPNKPQQVWFIKLLGNEVNLGNIAPHEVIPLETRRLGLRGDTFSQFFPLPDVLPDPPEA